MFLTSIFFLYLFAPAHGNTEITNFFASNDSSVQLPFALDWPTLNATNSELQWTLPPAAFGTPLAQVCDLGAANDTQGHQQHCPHELWLALELAQSWSNYSKFTMRISWPASLPADFSIQTYSASALSAYFNYDLPDVLGSSESPRVPPSRWHYARIRVLDTGVLTPPLQSESANHPATVDTSPRPIPFIVVLEPLYFGVLPPSVVPVLWYILLVAFIALFAVPRIERHLRRLAAMGKMEYERRLNEGTRVKEE